MFQRPLALRTSDQIMEVVAVPEGSTWAHVRKRAVLASIAFRTTKRKSLGWDEALSTVTTGPRHVLNVIEWKWRMHRRLQSVLARRLERAARGVYRPRQRESRHLGSPRGFARRGLLGSDAHAPVLQVLLGNGVAKAEDRLSKPRGDPEFYIEQLTASGLSLVGPRSHQPLLFILPLFATRDQLCQKQLSPAIQEKCRNSDGE